MKELQSDSSVEKGALAKKPYVTPTLRIHGKASELTQGGGIGIIDIGTFGLANPGGGGGGGAPGWS